MSHTRRLPLRSPTPTAGKLHGWEYARLNMRLETLDDFLRELGVVYRMARGGTMRVQDASRFAFMLRQGAEMAHELQELAELRALNQQLQLLRYHTNNYVTLPHEGGNAIDGELLTAREEKE